LDKILQTLSRAIFIDWEELDMIVKAYAKDPESMKGIAKKIMKKNTL